MAPRPDPATAADAAEFLEALRQLHAWAGSPSLRTLCALAGTRTAPDGRTLDVLPISTLSDNLTGKRLRLPRRAFVKAFVAACGRHHGLPEDDVVEEVEYWRVALRRLEQGKPPELPVPPPELPPAPIPISIPEPLEPSRRRAVLVAVCAVATVLTGLLVAQFLVPDKPRRTAAPPPAAAEPPAPAPSTTAPRASSAPPSPNKEPVVRRPAHPPRAPSVAPTAAPPARLPVAGAYRLHPAAKPEACLDDIRDEQRRREVVAHRPCDRGGEVAQLVPTTGDTHRLEWRRATTMCLGIEDGSSREYDALVPQPCAAGTADTAAHQRFRLTARSSPAAGYQLQSVHSGKCLSIEGRSPDGTWIVQRACDGGAAQTFVLENS